MVSTLKIYFITGPVWEQGSGWNNLHEKTSQFPASYLTKCGCIKAEAKLRLGYYGIEQNPIAELDLGRFNAHRTYLWDGVHSDAQISLKR